MSTRQKIWRGPLIVMSVLQALIAVLDLTGILGFGEMPPQHRIVRMEISTVAAYVMYACLTWGYWGRPNV